MKKIDRLLLTSFVPPFITAFLIAMFVLLMQTLWLYIDDIAGKGLGFFLVVELLAYKCVALIPLALPIAILISSVMVIGNLAENYELSSFKSAGVPLLRVMRPIMFIGGLAVAFSYYCSNYLMPIANLKFGSRMYDIQRQKPALRLDAGVFNYDFHGYAIHIGHKKDDDRSIQDILIYDHSQENTNEFSQIVAEEGEMYMTEDGHYFIMNLFRGHQYVETRPGSSQNDKYPFIRTSFDQWTKAFDLGEFQLSRTDEDLFKSNRSMLTIDQLYEAVDSLDHRIRERETIFSNLVSNYFHFMELDSTFLEPSEQDTIPEDSPAFTRQAEGDTLSPDSARVNQRPPARSPARRHAIEMEEEPPMAVTAADTMARRQSAREEERPATRPTVLPVKKRDKYAAALDTAQTFARIFDDMPVYERKRLYSKAKTFARSIQQQSTSAIRFLGDMRESHVKHVYDLHMKYSMAVVCFIFVFIGAPMGAIVRKGGFGYPILISIIFFMLFVILTIFCRKIAESFILPATVAAWVPNAILLPVGLTLTRKAMNDLKLLNVDRYTAFFRKLFKRKETTTRS